MRPDRFALCALLAVAALGAAGRADIESQTAVTYDPADLGAFVDASGSDVVVGWAFSIDQAITIDSLGLFDADASNTPGLGIAGFIVEHEIGVYNAGGTLLASAVLAAGTSGTLIGDYRYVGIGDGGLFLQGESTFTIAVTIAAGDWVADEQFDVLPSFNDADLTFGSGINPIESRFGTASSLSPPTIPMPLGTFAGAVNFTYEVIPAPPAIVPLAMAGLMAARRRRPGA